MASRPQHWVRSQAGLVAVEDEATLSQLQFLLDATHLEENNWTRDRGCAIHGVNACASACIYANRAPVPVGYRLVRVLRNQNPALWARYSLMRSAIAQECRREGHTLCPLACSSPALDSLDQAVLAKEVNEWRLFHGSTEGACRAICERNFDLQLAGQGATWRARSAARGTPLYGPGVYCAERVTKADEYAGREARSEGAGGEPTFCMLLCRVVGGRPCVCTDNEIDIGALHRQVLEGPAHSVLGDRVKVLQKPYREVVIYDKDQVYPEFLLSYERIFS